MSISSSSAKRVAVVTGGAMGIGGEVCARLAGAGHKVVVADLNLDAAETAARRLREAGGQAAALGLDVGQLESVAFEQVAREHGRCDILVNSAGIAKVFPFIDFPLDNFVATAELAEHGMSPKDRVAIVSGGSAPLRGIDSAVVPGWALPCAS